MRILENGDEGRNKNGGFRLRQFRRTLEVAIATDASDTTKIPRLRQAADMLLNLAAEGDLGAIKELADRLDGKPAQAVQVEGGETPVITKAIVELIRADAQAPNP